MPANPYGHSEQDLNLPDPDMDTGAMLDNQVQKAQEQLLALRRQADQIEKQKRELEDLSQRQEELERGRNDMLGKLSRSISVIERESVEAERRVEHLRATHEAFTQHLDLLEAINPKAWSPTDLSKELTRAQSDVEDARAIYAKNRAKIGAETTTAASYTDEAPPEAKDFLYWLSAGFAFTLPLLVLGLIAVALFLFHTAK
jgi:chromosome segregation ATPase